MLEDRNAALKAKATDNAIKIERYKVIEKQHQKDNAEYELIRNSTITKERFYDAEPDFYENDLLNF